MLTSEVGNMSHETDLKHEVKEEVLDDDNNETTDEFKDENNQINVKLEQTEPLEYYESKNNPGINNEYLEDLQNVTIVKEENLQVNEIESEDPLDINTNQQKSKSKLSHKKFQCSSCDSSYTRKSHLKAHINAFHEGKGFNCNVCGKIFKDSYNLNRHVTSMHENKKNFHCQLCPKTYAELRDLNKHISVYHQNDGKYKCEFCEMEFPFLRDKNQHLFNIHQIIVPPLEETSNDETKEKFECQYCQKLFSKKSNMKSHISIVHDGVKNFTCNECGSAFARNFDYKRHLISVHSAIDPETANIELPGYSSSKTRYPRIRRDYKCDQCDKTYTRPTRLKTHIAQAHMGEKMYCCQHCGKDFIGKMLFQM